MLPAEVILDSGGGLMEGLKDPVVVFGLIEDNEAIPDLISEVLVRVSVVVVSEVVPDR